MAPLVLAILFRGPLQMSLLFRDHYPSNVQFGLEMKWRTGQDDPAFKPRPSPRATRKAISEVKQGGGKETNPLELQGMI
jgi:hypothetical protein